MGDFLVKNKYIFNYLSKILIITAFAFIVLLGYVNRHQLGSIKVFNVVSDSMLPSVKKGSIIISRQYTGYSVGDVVIFKSPIENDMRIMHRIDSIDVTSGENYIYRTKGDNNYDEDPWQLYNEDIIGKVFLVIPFLGLFVSIIQKPLGALVFVALPMGGLLFWEIEELIKNIKRYNRSKRNDVSYKRMPYGI